MIAQYEQYHLPQKNHGMKHIKYYLSIVDYRGSLFPEVEFINDFLADRYERFCPPRKTETIRDFMNMKLNGRWLITMRGHITCVVDGILYDTFDCSESFIWCIYKVK